MSWTKKKISDLGNIVTGKTPSTKVAEYFGGEYPFVTPSDIEYGHYYVRKTETTVTEQAKNKHRNQFIPKDSVLFTCIGNTMGKCAIASQECISNQQINAVVANDDHDPKFLYYLLHYHRNLVRGIGMGGGAATPIINKTTFGNIKLGVPADKTDQKAISSLLEKYDDLIENNKRRIELLEESARQLYKEWFVRFRFPGHEHVKITDGVPEGWEKKTILELSSFLSRGMTPKYDDEGRYVVINQKCIRNRALSMDLVRRQSKDFKEEKLVQNGDVLINSTGTGTLGRVAQCWIDIKDCTVDTHVTIVRPKMDICSYWFGYCLMELESIFESMGEGATNQKELKRDLVGALNVLTPPLLLQSEFQDIASSNIKQITNLVEQNKNLIRARDLLLPKLMSGEVVV